MGVVYRAQPKDGGPPVAVKVLQAELAADPACVEQFVREGQAASVSNHPGIVGVLDFGRSPEGTAYLVMELLEGPTLEQVLADGALEAARALVVARRIAAALEAAHVRGVVHRDLKPSNVFLDPLDFVKLADFGAAKLRLPMGQGRSAGTTGPVMGTPLYMAPEQALGQPTDERTDVYALGCILFQMVAGRPPFLGRDISEVLRLHASTPAPQAVSPYGRVTADVEAILRRALAKRPDERYASVGEMGADLERALRTLPPPEG